MSSAKDGAVLAATGLTLWRGDDPLFESVSLTVSPGEILQIEGNNGAGKTTLLKILCGLTLADEGEVHWRGQSITRARHEFLSDLLYLGHKPGLKQELTALENLRSLARLRWDYTAVELDRRLHEALQTMQLESRTDLPCAVLSAGQKRRVALARLALSYERLWILDEPLTSLDRDGREQVEALMREQLERGGSIVYTTHQPLTSFATRSRSLRLG